MTRRSAALCALAAALALPAARAQQPTISRVDYDVTALEYPPLPPLALPNVRRVTLPNGLRVLLLEDHELPIVGAAAILRTGDVWVPDGLVGLAGVTGQAMRAGGTPTLGPDAVDRLLENVGARLDLYIGETSGSAQLEAPADQLDTLLPVLADLIARPVLAEDAVSLAVRQAGDYVRRRNDATLLVVNREFDRLVYSPGSPYARQPTFATLGAIDRAAVVRFHEQFVRPESVVLSVWGDFDADHVEALLRESFAGWGGPPRPPVPPPAPTGEPAFSVNLVQKDGEAQSTVRLGYLGEMTYDSPDYAPVLVMNEVLSGGPSSRLFSTVRTQMGLAYSVRARYWAGYGTPVPFAAEVVTSGGTTVRATRALLREIERMREAPPTEAEVALARDAFLNSFAFNFITKATLMDQLMAFEFFGYPPDFLQRTQAAVARVTPADVFRVSQKYLHPDRVSILVVGDAAGFDEPLTALAPDGHVHEIALEAPVE